MVVVEWVVRAALSRRGQSSTKAGLVASFLLHFSRKEFLRIFCFCLTELHVHGKAWSCVTR